MSYLFTDGKLVHTTDGPLEFDWANCKLAIKAAGYDDYQTLGDDFAAHIQIHR